MEKSAITYTCGVTRGRGGTNVTERVSRTKVEFKSGVQPEQSSGLHNVSHGLESTGRPGYMEPLCGGD